MNPNKPKHPRILAIAPATSGVGFAVMEGQETLVDWGIKTLQGDKNVRSLAIVDEMISLYRPERMVIEDYGGNGSRRCARIRALGVEILALASKRGIKITQLSRDEAMQIFFADQKGTKDGRAQVLARRFPVELAERLPPERKAWMAENYQMPVFDAVALALTLQMWKPSQAGLIGSHGS